MVPNRLKEYIDFKQISIYAFENAIGCSRGAIAKAIKESKSIGSVVVENILRIYPDLNPSWLLTGQGNMIRYGEIGHTQIGEQNTIDRSPITIATNTTEVEQLKKENELLKARLKDKEEIINLLKNNK
ncbi:MAG: hypothetical protein NC324_02215 [Bacteroides sp.]|nr:hypothetical protein [Bacteroides sp.]